MTARDTPVGTPLRTPFATKITLGDDPDISFFEKVVKPPAVIGGDMINQTTMFNTAWRTKWPKTLKELGPVTGSAAYEPAVFSQIIAQINSNQEITVTFPDTDTLVFYGALTLFDPQDLDQEESDQPIANYEIMPTLLHPTTGAETAPVVTGSGTDAP